MWNLIFCSSLDIIRTIKARRLKRVGQTDYALGGEKWIHNFSGKTLRE
jgi:hypothetical protein